MLMLDLQNYKKKRKAAADSLPPHLKLDTMRKAFASSHSDKSNTFTQEEASYKQRDKELMKTKKAMDFRHRNIHKGGDDDVNETISTSDTKRLEKATVLSFSNDPKSVDRARARQVEVDYKDLMKQQAAKRKKKIKEAKMTPMQDNNLFGNAYAGSAKLQKEKKKAIDAIPNKSTEVYNRNWKHKTPDNPRESVEVLHDANGKVAHEIVDIIKPEPMKVPDSPVKWKELTEKVKLPAVNGSIIDVYLTWRGRGISIKLFFPQSRTRRPTREEVNSQIQKVYPGAKVGSFIESDPEPGQPFLQVGD